MEINGLRFEWLPEGYEYVDGEETERVRRVELENGEKDYIRVRVTNTSDSSAYTYDNEAKYPTKVQIGEFEGWLDEKEEGYTLLWVDSERNKTIFVFSTNLPKKRLLQLAESLRY